MARPADPTARRPPCPRGHLGRVLLDGYYGRAGFYRRPQYRCVPSDGSRFHRFTEPLARRQATPDHPHGAHCDACGHRTDRNSGLVTGRGFHFSPREAGRVLADLGAGKSLRLASQDARRLTERGGPDAYGINRVSRHAQLAINYLTAFGGLVTEGLMPVRWPDAVILDSVPFLRRSRYADGSPRQGGPPGFNLFGAYAYSGGAGTGALWRVDARGGADQVEWEAFLRSLPGSPSWVVADGSGAIKNAVAAVWPDATFYACEGHLSRLGDKALALDDIFPGQPLHELWKSAQWSQAHLDAFEVALAEAEAPAMRAWLAKNRPLIGSQFALRQKGRPRSTGALETSLGAIKASIGTRHFVFRNLPRLRLLLDLMVLDQRRDADERRYAELIRRSFVANDGRPPRAFRALDDRDAASIGAQATAVAKRLASVRERNRALAERSEVRKSAGRAERKTRRRAAAGRLPLDRP